MNNHGRGISHIRILWGYGAERVRRLRLAPALTDTALSSIETALEQARAGQALGDSALRRKIN